MNRRKLLATVLGIISLVGLGAVAAHPPAHWRQHHELPTTAALSDRSPAPKSSTPISRVVRIGHTVSDLDRSIAFYTGVLNLEELSEREVSGEAFERITGVFAARARVAILRLGSEELELTQFLSPEGRPLPAESRSNDLWFQHIAIVVSDMDAAYAHLRNHRVRQISSEPQTLPASLPNAAGITASYFKDPDGHPLELIHFPKGKGDPRWQAPTERVFLGIDHTAIATADTDASVRFYTGVLGLQVVGGSLNYGTEQEHLNGVFNCRVRITTLAAASGPKIELLEYLAPGDGRPIPLDTRASDLWHWAITLEAPQLGLLDHTLDETRTARISAGIERIDGLDAASVRDPTGHALTLVGSPLARNE